MAFTSRRFLGTFQGLFTLILLLAAVRPAKAQTSYDFVPVTPCRIADTRNATGPFGGPSLAGGSTRSFAIPSSSCGIPSTAGAYSLNVTVVPGGTLGYISMWPTGQAQPLVSTLNSLDGRVKANAAIVPAGTGGAVSVYASDATNVILDINGYFVPTTVAPAVSSGLAFYPLTPCRIADTRNATGSLGGPSLVGGQSRSFPVRSACGIPSTAQAYSLNFTAIPQGTLGYLSVWPAGQTQPLVSTLNASTGTVTANAAIVPAGTGGAINLYTTDNADMVVDVNGYFAPLGPGGLSLFALTPCRVLDSRQNVGAFSGTINVNVTGSGCGAPGTAQAYVFNATVVPPGSLGYLSLWPAGAAQPLVSTLNAIDGSLTSNMALVPTTNGSVSAYTSNLSQLILDISGYFAPGPYTVGGTVSGLTGSGLVLVDNGENNLSISGNGSFQFPASIASGGTYDVTVLTDPSSPAQTCAVTNGSGTVSGAVTNVQVTCGTMTLPTVTIVTPAAPPLQAGGSTRTFTITVANDVSGDLPTVTSFTLNGVACTSATCGSFGAVTGAAGSGSYGMIYTPPPSLTAAVSPTVTVSPSVSGAWFAGTTSFTVDPSGVVVTFASSPGLGFVLPGSAARTLTYTVYNDVGGAGVTITLTASGYACQSLSTNSCGTLGTPVKTVNGTTTTTTVTYTLPASVPAEPYDRPRIQATSVAAPTNMISKAFLIIPSVGSQSISLGEIFDSALTGGAPVELDSNFTDTTSAKSASWTITAGAVSCTVTPNSTPCVTPSGTLAVPTVTTNGNNVTSTVFYTPPASVPTAPGEAHPTITTAETANSSFVAGFDTFNIVNGACGTGNNGLLNGQYAFLLKGGAANAGYSENIGSFTADGNGNITGGFEDINRNTGVLTDLTVTGTYSVGPDNRGCLTLTNSNGGTGTFRFALGTISSGTATQGTITGSSDTTGQVQRLTGVLKQQNLAGLTSTTFNGTYAFGRSGVDSSGHPFSAAGLITPNGAGTVTSTSFDFDDGGTTGTLSGGSGSYSLATNAPGGRGTAQITINSVTSNYAFYVVSPSDVFVLSTDPTDANHPIISGENLLQTGTFSTSVLNGGGYVFYAGGVDPSNGGSDTVLAQSQFTTSGNATVTIDENTNGISQAEASGAAVFSVASNGRVTATGSILGYSFVTYMVDSTQGFVVGLDPLASSGYIQKQTVSSFSTSTISGQFFFGGGAPTDGGEYDSGTANFSPGTPSGILTGTDDGSSPDYLIDCPLNVQGCTGGGLQPNGAFSGTYNFTTAPTAPGQGNIGSQTIAYIISPSKIVMMQTGTSQSQNSAEIYIIQQ
jgi:hypothetical protein